MAEAEEHPADHLIVQKAKNKLASLSESSALSSQMSNQTASRKGAKRKRSPEMALNIHHSGDLPSPS